MAKSTQMIGMFGTCGNSTWRTPFIDGYTKLNIPFFNPQLGPGEWNPACAAEEARHLAKDSIIVLPITGETTAFGSLSEVGFSVLNAIKLDSRRYFIVYIADKMDESLMLKDPTGCTESLKMRALVTEHLKKLNLDNIYVVDNLENMYKCSVILYNSNIAKESIEEFSVKNRNIDELIAEYN